MRQGSLAAGVAGALLLPGVAGSAPADPSAHAARKVVATEHVTLALFKKTGTKFRHKGRATGTVAGSVSSQITLTSLSIKGTVTVRAKGGTLRLRVTGDARSGGPRAKFDGTATMDGGTGRYAKARGSGTFTGVVNRRTWAATIDAHGSMTY
jgi:hypothetical protein